MNKIILLTKQEFRVLLSDKKALILLFLMPALLIIFLSLALTDVYHQKVGKNIKVIFLSQNNILSDEIISQFEKFGYSVKTVTEHNGVENYIHTSKSDVIIEIPKGISKLIKGSTEGNKIKMYFEPALDASYKELIKSHFLVSMQSMVIDQVNNKLSSMKGDNKKDIQVDKLVTASKLIDEISNKTSIPNPIQQTVPAWSLFAMFFIALPMSGSLIRDRETGILKRLLGCNLKKSSLLLGKLIPYFIINNLQFLSMFLLGLYVVPYFTDANFKMEASGLDILVVSLICSLAATSYGLLVSTLSKSIEQASSFGAIAVVLMALFGGVMIPHFVLPTFMQKISFLSPLYWGLESYLDLFLRNISLIEVLPRLYILLLFSACAFLISLFKFKWSD